MITFNDRSKNSALGIIALIIFLLFLLWFLRPKAANPQANGNTNCPICGWLSGLLGPAGPAQAANMFGTNATGQPNMAFQTLNYNVPVPSYYFPGQGQIYMPMFGFVGYSNSGTA